MSYEKLRQIILVLDAGIDLNENPENAHIKYDVGLNSLQLLELVGAVEDAFDIDIPERKVRDLQQINQIVAFIDDVCLHTEAI
jgi:acyl carrier protein